MIGEKRLYMLMKIYPKLPAFIQNKINEPLGQYLQREIDKAKNEVVQKRWEKIKLEDKLKALKEARR